MDRDKLIEAITANSNIRRESLEGMGDQCLQATHEHIVGNDDGGEGGDGGDGTDADGGDDPGADADDEDGEPYDGVDTDDDGNVIVADRDELESLIDDRVEQRVEATANRREKADRVDHIVANSAEYDADDREELMDTPDGVLDRIERGIGSSFEVPAATGSSTTANQGGDDADPSEFPSGV